MKKVEKARNVAGLESYTLVNKTVNKYKNKKIGILPLYAYTR